MMQPKSDKSLPEPFAARFLPKGRRRHLRKPHLPAAKFHFLVMQVEKSGMDGAQLRNPGHLNRGAAVAVDSEDGLRPDIERNERKRTKRLLYSLSSVGCIPVVCVSAELSFE